MAVFSEDCIMLAFELFLTMGNFKNGTFQVSNFETMKGMMSA